MMKNKLSISNRSLRAIPGEEQNDQLLLRLKLNILVSNPKLFRDIDWAKMPQFIETSVQPVWNDSTVKCPDMLARVFLKKEKGKPVLVVVESFNCLEKKLGKRAYSHFGRAMAMYEETNISMCSIFASPDNPVGCNKYRYDTGHGTTISFGFRLAEVAKLNEKYLPELLKKIMSE
ncbi:MAG TPA: hypothetical protein ENJ20_01860 [Bacteroidetes bacterium]|nr:hypothetical protein [Bacteroidota bacterium]